MIDLQIVRKIINGAISFAEHPTVHPEYSTDDQHRISDEKYGWH
jgi:hypothetical protein